MTSVFMRKGQMVGGVFVPAGMAVYGLSASEAALAAQGGDGLVIPDPDAVQGGGNPLVAAPATLDASNVATYNGQSVSLAAGATLTVHDGAWAGLDGGLTIQVGQSGSATLAFSGTATKENASGTSASSVTLSASGVYVITKSPSGTPKLRLSGGASL